LASFSKKRELRMQSAVPTCKPIAEDELVRIRAVADYQFGAGSGDGLFPIGVLVVRSRKTGKVKSIFYDGKLLATLKPNDGFLAMSVDGANRLVKAIPQPRYRGVVINDVLDFIKQGRNLFAKHVLSADPEIRPGEEVIITDSKDRVVAVGRAALNGIEMKRFKIGLAVKVRRGEGLEEED
jgi:predicted RNA-binding protein (TIGR00451 family)